MKNAYLTGERVVLRPLEMEDLPVLQEGINSPDMRATIAAYRPQNAVSERAWLENMSLRTDVVHFGIALRESQELIGSTELRLGPPPFRAADLGIGIFQARHQGKGYGREAIRLLLGYGFHTLNLHRVELKVHDNNPRGRRCYEACGFRHEGTLRQAVWREGRWWDAHVYGLLEPEWRASQSATRPV